MRCCLWNCSWETHCQKYILRCKVTVFVQISSSHARYYEIQVSVVNCKLNNTKLLADIDDSGITIMNE